MLKLVPLGPGSNCFSTASLLLPANLVFNPQSRHAFELCYVVGDQYEFVGECVGGDPQVVIADGFAANLKELRIFP